MGTYRSGSLLTRAWALVNRVDWRIKAVLLLVLGLFLVAHISRLATMFPRQIMWLGSDACSVWRARGLSLSQSTEWWQQLCALEHDMGKIDYNCTDKRQMGNRQVCFDAGLIPKDNCLVYSFGIAYDFTFDDAMAALGCTVYSFDPSMNRSDHKHADRVFFKAVGISGKDKDDFRPRLDSYVHSPITWRVRRLTTIMKELGHAKGSLTILKVDVESSEWDVVEDILSTEGLFQSIPQLLIEWHLFADAPPRTRYDHLVDVYSKFRNTGFLKFHWNDEGRDHYIGRLRSQSETSWVNPRFLHKMNTGH